jgi:CRISPR-associated endoribonuclease Cas6
VNKGNMLRGAFGNAFRRLCCIPQCRDARSCPLAESCPYKQIFEPSPPPGAERLSKNQDIPRPFIFRPPPTTQTHFERGESFEFELVLIGRALEYIPYFVLAFRELADVGLGLNRGRCTLDGVWSAATCRRFSDAPTGAQYESGDKSPHSKGSSGALVYSAEDQLFRSVKGIDSSEWIESRIRELQSAIHNSQSAIRISFLTPTFIRANGQVIREPEFHHIFKRLRDRINALSTFFGDGPLDVDFRGLGERSEKLRRVAARFEWIDRARTSAKTGQRHELSGFVGEATYEGEIDEFLPWLALGELVHVGKHAPWGNGRLIVDRRARA